MDGHEPDSGHHHRRMDRCVPNNGRDGLSYYYLLIWCFLARISCPRQVAGVVGYAATRSRRLTERQDRRHRSIRLGLGFVAISRLKTLKRNILAEGRLQLGHGPAQQNTRGAIALFEPLCDFLRGQTLHIT